MTFGEFLRAERRKRGWSLKELGEKLRSPRSNGSVSPQYLNDLELDRRTPSDDLLEQFGKLFQVSLAELRARCEKGSEEVERYLADHPQVSQEIGRAFRKARQQGFSDWKRVTKLIEGSSGN